MAGDATALEVAERVSRAADELSAAASLIPSCPCDQLDPERMGKVGAVGSLGAASCFTGECAACLGAHSMFACLPPLASPPPQVVADTARAEAAAAQVHSAFRALERAHGGQRTAMATLEVGWSSWTELELMLGR